jgi:hypothetical protein
MSRQEERLGNRLRSVIAVDQIEPAVAPEAGAEMMREIARLDPKSQPRSHEYVDERESNRKTASLLHHADQVAVGRMVIVVPRAGETDVLEKESGQPYRIRSTLLPRERLRQCPQMVGKRSRAGQSRLIFGKETERMLQRRQARFLRETSRPATKQLLATPRLGQLFDELPLGPRNRLRPIVQRLTQARSVPAQLTRHCLAHDRSFVIEQTKQVCQRHQLAHWVPPPGPHDSMIPSL